MPDIKWIGSPNFHETRDGHSIIAIVNHIMCGTEVGTDAWFQNPQSQVSAHYGIAKDGAIHQYVKDEDTAWSVGLVNKPTWKLFQEGLNPNLVTVSIEHEGYPQDGLTEAQYQSTLWLHEQLIAKWKIPVDADHIIGHCQLDTVNRTDCPGPKFPWSRLFYDLQPKGGHMVTLQVGSTNEVAVKQLQHELNLSGANPPLVEDGNFGPKTESAVRMFQHNHKLVEDGIVGPLTWGALDASQPAPAPAPEPQPTPTPAPRTTSDHEVIAVVQGTVDGDKFYFSPQGKKADGTFAGVGHLLLDTGAECLLLDQAMATAFGLQKGQDVSISGVTGSSQAYESTITLKFGDAEYPNQFCIVDPEYAPMDDGLFGLKFFVDNHLDFDVDLDAGTLTLYKKVTK